MSNQAIRITLKAYDHRVLDLSAQQILEAAERTGAAVAGPIPMPTNIRRFCVLRSPHVNKKSREHFELRIHKRIIDIVDPGSKTIDSLTRLNVPAGVDIKMRLIEMINGLIGKKLKMTTSYDDDNGLAIPTTIIKLGPCKVTQVKTTKRDGYESVQIGFDEKKV